MAYTCETCGTTFPKQSELLQHKRMENHWQKYACETCGKVFIRKSNLTEHMKKHTTTQSLHCDECGQTFSRQYTLNRHKERAHQTGRGSKRPAESTYDSPTKRLRSDEDPRQYYHIEKIKDQYFQKYRTTSVVYKVHFNQLEVTNDVLNTIERLFMAIFEDITQGAKTVDLIRLVVQSPTLDYPLIIPLMKVQELTVERFLSEIERVLQSNEDFTIDESLTFEIIHIDMPKGGAHKRCKFVDLERKLREKKCFIRIQNKDDLCCARAIVTAKAKIDQHEKWDTRQGRIIQKQLAEELHKTAGVPLGPCGIDAIKKFQNILPDYQIHVVSADHFNGIIEKGPENEKKIYLYYHDQHYDVITSMPAFLNKSYYCAKCQKGYDYKETHACNNACHNCKRIHSETDDRWIKCQDCNRFFKGQQCFDLHQKTSSTGNSTCTTYSKCQECGKNINKRLSSKPHVCGSKYCDLCKDFFGERHQCYMLPEELEEDEEDKTYIFSI